MSLPIELMGVLETLLGGLLAIIASVLVAILYLRFEREKERRAFVYRSIEEIYLDNSITPLQNAMSIYGSSCVYAFIDVRKSIVRRLKNEITDVEVKAVIDEIIKRKYISDLMSRDFSLIFQNSAPLHGICKELSGSIIIVLQNYSELLRDSLNYSILFKQGILVGPDEMYRSITSLIAYIQNNELFLIDQLEHLKQYILMGDYNSFEDFRKNTNCDDFVQFKEHLNGYHKVVQKSIDSFTEIDRSKAKKLQEEYNFWMKENGDKKILIKKQLIKLSRALH